MSNYENPIGECMGYCGDENVPLYDDLKTPPTSHEPCLCRDCFFVYAEEAIDEYEIEIELIKELVQEEKDETGS